MAVRKTWNIDHRCGHSVDHDLSNRPADKRAGWWIGQRDAEALDLPELLDAATDDDRGTENPFR
ncbi:hypothetical protein B7P34_02385 [Streptosporangium nondiastaticum]|uniref:Uncharacterized protein n=1 Tax=Streptosporangium nondiastaticum TaxID=35764 RepID=A0A9X7JVI7_9ACTN|nr:hypothetical protein [Streptosporangium nondiastaticum]PSJ30419.1 hypothetical protein B7P34_02385 [Streptosporangium nondiastaticum]